MNRDIDVDVRPLASLPAVAPDPQRAEQTRQRCRALLERRVVAAASEKYGSERRQLPSRAAAAWRNAMVAACGILCIVYVVALVLTTAALQRALEIASW
jgi:hypothetical protein